MQILFRYSCPDIFFISSNCLQYSGFWYLSSLNACAKAGNLSKGVSRQYWAANSPAAGEDMIPKPDIAPTNITLLLAVLGVMLSGPIKGRFSGVLQ